MKFAQILLSAFLMLPAYALNAFVSYEDSVGYVQQHSNQKAEPFLIYGSDVMHNELRAKYENYIPNFRNVRDCLQADEAKENKPDLTKFAWNKFDSDEAVAICLFRVANSYDSPKSMLKWFESQNLQSKIVKSVTSNRLSVYATNNLAQKDIIYSTNIFTKLSMKFFAQAQTFNVVFEDNKVISAKASATYK